MLRVTMIRTIPVAMIATTAVCTDRFQMFLGVRKVWPGVMIWKRIQMIAKAPSSERSRVSTSADRKSSRSDPLPRSSGAACASGSRSAAETLVSATGANPMPNGALASP
jgi:hypothetical protein